VHFVIVPDNVAKRFLVVRQVGLLGMTAGGRCVPERIQRGTRTRVAERAAA